MILPVGFQHDALVQLVLSEGCFGVTVPLAASEQVVILGIRVILSLT